MPSAARISRKAASMSIVPPIFTSARKHVRSPGKTGGDLGSEDCQASARVQTDADYARLFRPEFASHAQQALHVRCVAPPASGDLRGFLPIALVPSRNSGIGTESADGALALSGQRFRPHCVSCAHIQQPERGRAAAVDS